VDSATRPRSLQRLKLPFQSYKMYTRNNIVQSYNIIYNKYVWRRSLVCAVRSFLLLILFYFFISATRAFYTPCSSVLVYFVFSHHNKNVIYHGVYSFYADVCRVAVFPTSFYVIGAKDTGYRVILIKYLYLHRLISSTTLFFMVRRFKCVNVFYNLLSLISNE